MLRRNCFTLAVCIALAFEARAQTSTSPSGVPDKAAAAASTDANHAGMNAPTENLSSPPTGDSKTLEQIEHPLAYPPEALEKGIQGKVVVKVSILETGAVESVEPVSGDPILTKAAVEAVKQWKFKPFIRGGKAIKVASTLPVNFALPGASDSTMVEPIKMVWPAYPKQAESENMQGQALVRASINESGDVEKEEIVDSTDRVFNQPALDAVKLWKFKPFLAHGKPIPVTVRVPVDFAFSDKVSDTVTPVQKYAREEPTPSDAPKPARVASGVMVGKLIHRVDPAYPWQARNWHIQGTVVLHALITEQGRIGSLQLISGDQALVKAAIGAVQQWRYEPFSLDGKPIEVDTTIEVKFTMNIRQQ